MALFFTRAGTALGDQVSRNEFAIDFGYGTSGGTVSNFSYSIFEVSTGGGSRPIPIASTVLNLEFTGLNFGYTNVQTAFGFSIPIIATGTINSIDSNIFKMSLDRGTNLNISGGSFDVAVFKYYYESYNEEGLWNYLTAGNDVFISENGNDIIRAGTGNDTVYITGTGNKVVYGGTGSNNIYSGAADDVLIAGNLASAALDASAWSVVYGDAGNDYILAGHGSNTILRGGTGHDTIIDGYGTDMLEGGAGFDYLAAGTGTNYFMFGYDAFVGGQYDQVDYFNASATNYIGVVAGWAPYMSTAQYGSTAALNWQTTDGSYYSIYIYNATVAEVTSHLFFY